MKQVGVIGHFGGNYSFSDGQTVKTKIVTNELIKTFGEKDVATVDTYGGIKKLLMTVFKSVKLLKECRNIIMLPAHNGIRIFAPVLKYSNVFYKRKLHYCVIGGWLPEYLKKHKFTAKCLKSFDCIYVETEIMKNNLEKIGFKNITVVPNCKNLNILKENELEYNCDETYRFCTFSRVMKEKGIEDAIDAVKNINDMAGKTICFLDIYGAIDENYKERFENLKKSFPEYIKYCGVVPFDKSVEVLKSYFALLFPTYYEGEGFAGTLIDAFSAGVPVIASDWRYNKELIEHLKTGIVYPCKEAKTLTDAIKLMLGNKEIFEMKKNCLEEAKKYIPETALKPMINRIIK